MRLPKHGEKWGAFEIIESERVHDEVTYWVRQARCKCGRVVEFDRENWDGKRRNMDCGCGISKPKKKIQFRIYLDEQQIKDIQAICRVSEQRFSECLITAVDAGIGHLMDFKGDYEN